MSAAPVPVLVVEDDPTVADVVSTYLRAAGITVEHVADGVSALAAAARNRPDLVVLDLLLPGLRAVTGEYKQIPIQLDKMF